MPSTQPGESAAALARRSRRQARDEMELVEQALTRALGDSAFIYESLRWLVGAASRQHFLSHPDSPPVSRGGVAGAPVAGQPRSAASSRLLQSLELAAARDPISRLRGGARSAGEHGNDMRLRQPALVACFGTQAMSHLDQIGQLFQRARGVLNESSTRITRRAGSTAPGLTPAHGQVLAHAPVSEEGTYGRNAIHLYDPFFRIEDTFRFRLIERAGRANDLELLRAAVLVHEALHWEIDAGHQVHGDLQNPQNYEFYMPQRYARRPLSFSELNTFRRR